MLTFDEAEVDATSPAPPPARMLSFDVSDVDAPKASASKTPQPKTLTFDVSDVDATPAPTSPTVPGMERLGGTPPGPAQPPLPWRTKQPDSQTAARPSLVLPGSTGPIAGQQGTAAQPPQPAAAEPTELPEDAFTSDVVSNQTPTRYGRNAQGQLESKWDGAKWVNLFTGQPMAPPAHEEGAAPSAQPAAPQPASPAITPEQAARLGGLHGAPTPPPRFASPSVMGPSQSPLENLTHRLIPEIPKSAADSIPVTVLPGITIPAGLARGFLDTLTGAVTPANAAIAVGTAGIGELGIFGSALQKAIGLGFTGAATYGAGKNLSQAYDAYQSGDLDTAAEHLGMGTADGLFAALVGRATFRGLPDAAGNLKTAWDAWKEGGGGKPGGPTPPTGPAAEATPGGQAEPGAGPTPGPEATTVQQTHPIIDPKTGQIHLVKTETGQIDPHQAVSLLDRIIDEHDSLLGQMMRRETPQGGPVAPQATPGTAPSLLGQIAEEGRQAATQPPDPAAALARFDQHVGALIADIRQGSVEPPPEIGAFTPEEIRLAAEGAVKEIQNSEESNTPTARGPVAQEPNAPEGAPSPSVAAPQPTTAHPAPTSAAQPAGAGEPASAEPAGTTQSARADYATAGATGPRAKPVKTFDVSDVDEPPPTLEQFRANGEKEPPVEPGYVRLYRGHEAGEKPTAALEGNWWTPNLEHAEQHALDRAEGNHQVSYIDIPKGDLEKYSAYDHSQAADLVGVDENPYILPAELSKQRKTLFTYKAGEEPEEASATTPTAEPDATVESETPAERERRERRQKFYDLGRAIGAGEISAHDAMDLVRSKFRKEWDELEAKHDQQWEDLRQKLGLPAAPPKGAIDITPAGTVAPTAPPQEPAPTGQTDYDRYVARGLYNHTPDVAARVLGGISINQARAFEKRHTAERQLENLKAKLPTMADEDLAENVKATQDGRATKEEAEAIQAEVRRRNEAAKPATPAAPAESPATAAPAPVGESAATPITPPRFAGILDETPPPKNLKWSQTQGIEDIRKANGDDPAAYYEATRHRQHREKTYLDGWESRLKAISGKRGAAELRRAESAQVHARQAAYDHTYKEVEQALGLRAAEQMRAEVEGRIPPTDKTTPPEADFKAFFNALQRGDTITDAPGGPLHITKVDALHMQAIFGGQKFREVTGIEANGNVAMTSEGLRRRLYGFKAQEKAPVKPTHQFKEGERVHWTHAGNNLTGTIRSLDPTRWDEATKEWVPAEGGGTATIDVDQIAHAGGVPIGRVVTAKVSLLAPIKPETKPEPTATPAVPAPGPHGGGPDAAATHETPAPETPAHGPSLLAVTGKNTYPHRRSISKIPGARWNADQKVWTLPDTEASKKAVSSISRDLGTKPFGEPQPAETKPAAAETERPKEETHPPTSETEYGKPTPKLGKQIKVGDRIFTVDYGYQTVEAINPADPKYPNSVRLRLTREIDKHFDGDRVYTVESPVETKPTAQEPPKSESEPEKPEPHEETTEQPAATTPTPEPGARSEGGSKLKNTTATAKEPTLKPEAPHAAAHPAHEAEPSGTEGPGAHPAVRTRPVQGTRTGEGEAGSPAPVVGVHGPVARSDGEPEGAAEPGGGTAGRHPVSRPKRKRTTAPRTTKGPDLSHDYEITDADHIGEGNVREKAEANIAAIRLMRQIQGENRPATPEEQAVLAKFTGWGSTELSKLFGEPYYIPQNLKHIREAIDELMSPAEFKAAAGSTVNAHYTSPTVVKAMWDAMEHLGMQGGERVLEPSMGVGNFFGLEPEDLKEGSSRTGIELDTITGGIAKLLYPGSHVHVAGLEKVPLPDNFFDVAIGNVPFGDYKVSDPEFRTGPVKSFSIHNYFFAKALAKVREGGVVAFVTSSHTMDGVDPKVRQYLADQADLLGAIRLPHNAFKENAGTQVTTDVIFLRKRAPGTPPAGEPWVNTVDMEAPDKRNNYSTGNTTIPINEYYVAHPEMMLGSMIVRQGQRGRQVNALEGSVTPEKLTAAIAKLPKEALQKPVEEEPEVRIPLSSLPDPGVVKDGGYVFQDKQLMVRDGQELRPANLNENQTKRVRGLLAVRDAWRNVLQAQETGTEADAKQARGTLNKIYDAYTAANGPLSNRDNARAFAGDPDAPGLLSLEDYDPKTKTAKKADIFRKTTNPRYVPPETAPDAASALAIALNEYGGINWKRIQGLTGLDRAGAEKALADNGLIFKNPEGPYKPRGGDALAIGGRDFETADQYLSGDVRHKLRAAIAAAAIDPEYEPNVEALKRVQPDDLKPGEIDARLGAGWIPNDVIQQFLLDKLKVQAAVSHAEALATWNIGVKDSYKFPVHNATNTIEYGGSGWTGADLVEEAMNLRMPTVRVPGETKGSTVVDPVATAALREKQQHLKDLFRKWVWEDADRAEKLAGVYNERYNNLRLREFDGSHLKFPGMNEAVQLRPHQKNAIWRMLQGGNALLAHVVGAGKTFAMAAAAMEMRRLGTAKKPMIVVPNHLVQQWATEFMQLYPNANLFVAGEDTFSAGKRQKAMSRIANGNYDAVIIGHNAFSSLPVSDDTFNQWLNEQIDDLRNAMDEVRAAEGEKGPTVKDLQKAIKRLEAKLEKRAKREKKDVAITFEQMGVDQLFVDEADLFKNLFFTTKMSRIAGIPNTESDRAIDMFLKTRWLTRKRAGAGVVFATGTPISNSMAEMYTMMRYLNHRQLQETGLSHFDAWAQQYGETVTGLELAPSGAGYRMNSRFAKFVNLPELATAFRTFSDVQTADMLKLPTPALKGGKPIVVAADASDELKAFIGDDKTPGTLLYRASHLPKGRAAMVKGADNMLAITGDGRKAGLDIRLVPPIRVTDPVTGEVKTLSHRDNPNSKVNKAVDRVFNIWKETKEQSSTQLVFSDLSTPHGEGFSVYKDVRDKLIARGIPANEIAFIHDYDTKAKKQALFRAVNEGRIRVLMGSTEKMGAGMNVQKKLIALHHLDAPWRPRDIEQREGRILRQGNENKEVQIYRYVTAGSFDAYMWQTLEAKARFIASVMTNHAGVRVAEDIESNALTYAEIKAIASGSPKVMEKIKTDMEVRRLDSLRSAYENQLYDMRRQAASAPRASEMARTNLELAQADKERRDNAPDELWRIGGETFTGKDANKEAGAKLHELLEKDRAEVQAAYDQIEKDFRGRFAEIEPRYEAAEAAAKIDSDDPNYVRGSKARFQEIQEEYKALSAEKFRALRALADTKPVRLGTYRGFELWTVSEHPWQQAADNSDRRVYGLANIRIKGSNTYGASSNTEGNPAGTLASIRYHIDGIDKDISILENSIAEQNKKLRDLQELIARPFEHEAKLKELLVKQAQLNAELDLNKATAGTEGQEQEEPQEPEKAVEPEDEDETAESLDPAAPEVDRLEAQRRRDEDLHNRIREEENRPEPDQAKLEALRGRRLKLGESRWTEERSGTEKMEPPKESSTGWRLKGLAKEFLGEETGTSTMMVGAQRAAEDWRAGQNAFRKTFNPYALSPDASTAGLSLREHAAKAAQEFARAEKALESARKLFSTRSWDENLNFINKVEGGSPQPDPVLQQIADTMRQLLDSHREAVQALGKNKLTTFYENYFPHLWKRGKEAETIFRAIFGKRPIEGTKAFLKQRKFHSFQEGVDKGLVPVSENPVDLVLLKLKEMERYTLAHRFLEEMKSIGLAKYVPSTGKKKAPEGWVKIPDSIGTVWGPPFVTIPEAHDKQFMDTLLNLANDLGMDVQRVAKMRSAWGRAFKGTNRIKTRFAGPESIILHEMGHLLDWKYGLQDLLKKEGTRQGTFYTGPQPWAETYQRELRDLADLRLVGGDTPYFQKYVRKGEEKIANMVAAYGHAPKRFQKVAPNVYAWFDQFVKSHKELKPLADIEYGMQQVVHNTEYPVGGWVQRGNYYMPSGAAQIVSNYLAPGLGGNPLYQDLRGASNLMLQFALGFSGFHAGFVTFDSMVSRLALSMQYMAAGKPAQAAKAVASVPMAPFQNVAKGGKIRNAYLRESLNDPELAKHVDAIVAGGGRVSMDEQYRSNLRRSFMDAWRRHNVGRIALIGLPALAETLMWPVLEYLVPRMKLGIFADMVDFELKRLGPDATKEQIRNAFAGAWDSVDNRMGQLVYDDMFWDRTAKDLAMLTVQSVGWNIGTFRELLGAGKDTARFVADIGRGVINGSRGGGSRGGGNSGGSGLGTESAGPGGGKSHPGNPQFTRRMAYALALVVLTGTLGAIMDYVNTKGRRRKDGTIDDGHDRDLRDYFFPRTGNVDESGHDERMALWGYLKDMTGWWMEPTQSARNKLSPIIRFFAEFFSNRNFYNEKLWDQENRAWYENGLKELEHFGGFFLPLSISGLRREQQRGSGPGMQVGQLVGLRTAPSYVTRTPAERFIEEYENTQHGGGTPSEASGIERAITKALRAQHYDQAIDLAEKAVKEGKITDQQLERAMKSAESDPLVTAFTRLPLNEAIQATALMNEEEKARTAKALDKKLEGIEKQPPAEQKRLEEKLVRAGLLR